jgi:hypothetical protein
MEMEMDMEMDMEISIGEVTSWWKIPQRKSLFLWDPPEEKPAELMDLETKAFTFQGFQ